MDKEKSDPLFNDILAPPKDKRNPLVLVGALLTAGVLAAGLVAFKGGNAELQQKMMRLRVMGQGATVLLMFGTSGYVYGKIDELEAKAKPQA
mmetsp:Transcript_47575/g.152454  ORF Transcript_47575/g.152454 Transcript_47575/m.152454 type:complete len:92 (-) Transcript_47575:276-551(-)